MGPGGIEFGTPRSAVRHTSVAKDTLPTALSGQVFYWCTHVASVVPRARHCGIPAILPSMSLKNAPSAGLRARPRKFAF